MSITAVVLLVAAAFTHAGWNLLGKRSESNAVQFLIAAGLGLIVLAPFPLLFRSIVPLITNRIWLFLLCTGAFQALYYTGLSSGYRSGDMSIVYPFARAIPAVLVVLFSFIAGRSDRLSLTAIVGVALIVTGSILLPMIRFRKISWSVYGSAALGCAMIAAIGTAGYSIIDDAALSELRSVAGTGYPVWQLTGVFAFFEGGFSAIWLAIITVVLPNERKGYTNVSAKTMPSALLMGIGIYLTYTIVLISMAFVDEVSYVVAFRQLSIPVGVTLSALLLGEKITAPRTVGAAIMFAGVVLVGIG